MMNRKHIFCLALVVGGGLVGCSTVGHGVNLHESVEHIRASIFKMTPLGTPIEEVKATIQTKIHPDSFYYYKHAPGLPGTNQWPLGGEHHGKDFGCRIGSTGIPLLNAQDVDVDWVFDDQDRLADFFVVKFPDEP